MATLPSVLATGVGPGLIGDAAALPGLQQALADTDTLAGQRIAEAISRIGDRAITDRAISDHGG